MVEYQALIVGVICTTISTMVTLFITERIKGSVKNSFDEKIEDVKKEHSKEISQFQIELNHLKSKDNFKFTKLHEKRLEVLQKTYQYLNENLTSLSRYIAPAKIIPDGIDYDESEIKLSLSYRENYNEFLNYFNYNVIYFDEETETLLRTFFNESSTIFDTYDKLQIMKKMNVKPEGKEFLSAGFAYKKIPEIIAPLKKKIEDKFRVILGE